MTRYLSVSAALLAFLCMAPAAQGAVKVTVSPGYAHPTASVSVSGSGFAAF